MNELFKMVGVAITSLLIGAIAGVLILGHLKDGEISAIENDLRDAVAHSGELRARLRDSRRKAGTLERISKERQRKISEMEEELFGFIKRARARDKIIARLESRLEGLGGSAGEIAELAREGKEIATGLQAEEKDGEN